VEFTCSVMRTWGRRTCLHQKAKAVEGWSFSVIASLIVSFSFPLYAVVCCMLMFFSL
jgi:hypothetical protein